MNWPGWASRFSGSGGTGLTLEPGGIWSRNKVLVTGRVGPGHGWVAEVCVDPGVLNYL